MDSSFHLLLLLLAAASLVEGEDTLQDFVEVNYNFTFIYHDFQRLLLMIHESNCYYHKIDDHAREELTDVLTGRILYQTEMIGVVLRKSSTVQRSSLSAVRDLYGDRLADFHCLGKDIYNIPANAAAVQPTNVPDPCRDHGLYDIDCSKLSHSDCNADGFLKLVCPKTCSICHTTGGSSYVTPPPLNGETCYDRVGDGLSCQELPGVCHNYDLAQKLCPYHCGLCSVLATTAFSNHPTPTDQHFSSTVASATSTSYDPHCHDSLSTAARKSCEDHGREICSHLSGRLWCRKFCGFCGVEPSTSTKTSTPKPTTAKPATTKSLPSRPPKRCLQCGNLAQGKPCSDLELIVANTTLCSPDKPFCMNDIFQKGRDIKYYRRCVDEPTCYQQWYRSTSDKTLCLPFESSLAVNDLACHLCCYGDACNIDDNPPRDLLYKP